MMLRTICTLLTLGIDPKKVEVRHAVNLPMAKVKKIEEKIVDPDDQVIHEERWDGLS